MADYKSGAKNIKYEYLVITQSKKTINDYSGIISKDSRMNVRRFLQKTEQFEHW